MWFWRIFKLHNWNYRKRLINKPFECCSEDIKGNEMIYSATVYSYE